MTRPSGAKSTLTDGWFVSRKGDCVSLPKKLDHQEPECPERAGAAAAGDGFVARVVGP